MESNKLVVKTPNTDLLCFAKPGGDHNNAATLPIASSSPMEKILALAGCLKGHSSVVKLLTLNRTSSMNGNSSA